MRNKLWLGLAGGGILLVGLALGALINGGLPAFAFVGNAVNGLTQQTPPASSTYCQLYEQTLANELGVSTAKLESANQNALKAVIQQAFKDGKINQSQETTLLNNLSNLSSHPCAGLRLDRGFGFGGHEAGGLRGDFAGVQQAVLSAVASALKLQPADLQTDLQSGKTIAQLAQTANVSIDSVDTAYLNAAKDQLSKAVTAKTITQTQADNVYSKLQMAVAAGHYPGLEEGHGESKQATAPSS